MYHCHKSRTTKWLELNPPKRINKTRYCKKSKIKLNPYNHNSIALFYFYEKHIKLIETHAKLFGSDIALEVESIFSNYKFYKNRKGF